MPRLCLLVCTLPVWWVKRKRSREKHTAEQIVIASCSHVEGRMFTSMIAFDTLPLWYSSMSLVTKRMFRGWENGGFNHTRPAHLCFSPSSWIVKYCVA